MILRSREGLLQAVWEEGVSREDLKEFHEGDCIRVTGTVKKEERAPQGKELRIKETEFLSKVDQPAAPAGRQVEPENISGSQAEYAPCLFKECKREG